MSKNLIGALYLLLTCTLYAYFSIQAFPRQEWLLGVQVSILLCLPILHLFRPGENPARVSRLLGLALIAHSFWDSLHWPGFPLIQTPVDPRLPTLCPFLDLALGALLLFGSPSSIEASKNSS